MAFLSGVSYHQEAPSLKEMPLLYCVKMSELLQSLGGLELVGVPNGYYAP